MSVIGSILLGFATIDHSMKYLNFNAKQDSDGYVFNANDRRWVDETFIAILNSKIIFSYSEEKY